jgi:hypothetical protein
MTDIASHIRIFEASPTDDLVGKRQAAIGAIAEQFKKRTTFVDILGLAEGLAAAIAPKGKLPDGLASQVETALKDASPSFVMEGHQLEARVCALLGAASYLALVAPGEGAANCSDVLALGLWSALSFQKPLAETKLEKLRVELLGLARDLAVKAAENSRRRAPVPDGGFAPAEADGWGGIEKKWNTGPLQTLDALRRNAALDREEIDVLWWVMADWSAVYCEKLSSMDQRLSPLVASWEIAQLLKRMPAEAHKHLVLRLVQDGNKENLTDLITELGNKRVTLAQQIAGDAIVTSCPHVFPLLNAVTNPASKIAGDKEARAPADWASRALLESGLLRVTKLPAPIS